MPRRKPASVASTVARAPTKTRGPTRSEIPTTAPTDLCAFSGDIVAGSVVPADGAPEFELRGKVIDGQKGAIIEHYKLPAMLMETTKEPFPETYSGNCWWDSHPFSSKPVGCPVQRDDKRNIYWLEGIFCSWNCAHAYGNHYLPQQKSALCPVWIRHLIREMAKAQVSLTEAERSAMRNNLAPSAAPHWCLLKSFGGVMDIETFRDIHCPSLRLHIWPERFPISHIGMDCYVECPLIPIPRFSDKRVQRVLSSKAQTGGVLNLPMVRPPLDRGPTMYRYPERFDPRRIRRNVMKTCRKFDEQRTRTQPNPLVSLMNIKTRTVPPPSKPPNK